MNAKPIIQLDLEGKMVKRHKSLYHLCMEEDFDRTAVKKVLQGKSKASKGFVFRYEVLE